MNIQKLEQEVSIANDAVKRALLSGESQVQKFYDNATIFLTGGSGFIGKHLIEKLMRSSDIKKIYMLLRPKKGKTIEERLASILKDPIYEYLYQEKPDFAAKIVPIEGDVCGLKLGMYEKDWFTMADEVNIIFHTAATVNFKENIKSATLTNIRGTREVISLAKQSRNLKAIVHVSTAYSNATKSRIDKTVKDDFYKTPLTPKMIIELAESVDEDKLTSMTFPFMEEWPNSYTFTKAIAENLVREEAADLPICIIRPAIVVGAYQEPKPGWIDIKNAFGPSGIILGLGLGVTHTYFTRHDSLLDLVPVDMVNNTSIVAGYETYHRYNRNEKEIIIYTISGSDNPISWRDMSIVLKEERTTELIPSKSIWYCNAVDTQYKIVYLFFNLVFHYIPGLIVDGFCLLLNKQPRLFQTYRLIHNMSSVFKYFIHNCWNFCSDRTKDMYKNLSATDKIIYNCDMSTVNKREMVYRWSYGIFKYIARDDLANNAYALKKQFYFKIATFVLLPPYFYSLYKIALLVLVLLFNCLMFVINLFCFYTCTT